MDDVRSWGRFTETSPLYRHLTDQVAHDGELLATLNEIEHTPQPNILFAAVQYLLMRDGGAALAAYYPNLGGVLGPEGAGQPFAEFVAAHRDEIVAIGRSRYTQTNECRRCVALLPSIWMLPVASFHLVDLGTSAGLNLALDRYRYRWGDLEWGEESPVLLESENRGLAVEPGPIEVMSRTGLDLHSVDPADEGDRRWLEALVWPEHDDRRTRLGEALDLIRQVPIDRVAGDAVDTLGPTLDRLEGDYPAVVMNSFALNQFSRKDRRAVSEIIEGARAKRDVHRVSIEAIGTDGPWGLVEIDVGSGLVEVGRMQPHGEWVEFYARP